MSIFVVGIKPEGPAAADGRMRIGDELLEVRAVLSCPLVHRLGTEGHTQEANLDSVTSKLEPTESVDSLPIIPGLGR